ncbi:MAG: O-antigen ligase family protein, partial [Gaiellaceae bacterium]
MRVRLLLGATAVLLGAACIVGGSVPWIGLAALLAALAAGAPVVAGKAPRPELGPLGLGALALLCAFVVWNGASIAWSVLPDRTWHYTNLGLVYLAFAACGVLAGALLPHAPRGIAAALAAALGAVAVWALAGKVFAGLYPDYGRVARLREPVGYWNALALLGDMALPLALWLAGRPRHARAARLAGTLLFYLWVVAIALTQSRGGIAVGVVVVVAWLALDALRLESVGALAAAGVPAAVVAWVAFRLPGIADDGVSDAARSHDGWIFGLALVAGALAVAALTYGLERLDVGAERRRTANRALAAAGAVAAVAAVVAVGLNASSVWHQFNSSTSQVASSGCRLCSASSNFRTTWWRQAARGFADRPLLGSGAGSFQYTNLKLRHWDVDYAIEPHDLPLQFLSETGIVGFLLAAGAAGLGLAAIARRVLGAGPEVAPVVALALVPVAYLLHGLIDYDWDFVAVTGPAVFVGAALIARPGRAAGRSVFAGAAAVALAAAVFVSLLLPWLSQRATLNALGEDPPRVISLAKSARSYDPLNVDAVFAQADAEASLGHLARAERLFLDATRIQPDNAETWFRLGQFEAQQGCPRAAL